MNFWANVRPGFGSSENGAPLNGRSMTINLRTWPCRSCTWFGTVFPLNFLRQIVPMPEYCIYILLYIYILYIYYMHKYVYLSPSTYTQHQFTSKHIVATMRRRFSQLGHWCPSAPGPVLWVALVHSVFMADISIVGGKSLIELGAPPCWLLM